VALACLGVVIVAIMRSLPHEKKHVCEVDHEQVQDEQFQKRNIENRANLLAAWIAVFMANILVGATRSVYPKRVMNLLDSGEFTSFLDRIPSSLLDHAPATTFSCLVSALWIATALCFFLMGKVPHWHHSMRLLLWFQALAGGAAWVLGSTQSLITMIICFAIIGVNFGVSFFTAMSYSLADPVHKHRRAAITEGVLGAGGFSGSIAFGYFASTYGVNSPFLFAPVFVSFGVVLQWLLFCFGRWPAK